MKVETGLAFDDILLLPRKSDVLPNEVSLNTNLTKNIKLNIPLVSAAMDSVTESKLAIAIANEGGIGIVHKNMSIDSQAKEVEKVKKASSWIIHHPLTLSPDDTLTVVKDIMESKDIGSFPVIKDNKLVGILTNRDLRFIEDFNIKVNDVMTKDLITIPEKTSMEKAAKILAENKIEKLPIIDKNNKLQGLITVKDIEKDKRYPHALRDKEGRLKVGAAVGPFDFDRVNSLINAEVDVIIVDTAHGYSKNVINTVKQIKKQFDIELIAGNVALPDATEELISAGVDAVKVGIGPGSICTTRIVSGVGVPQFTAIKQCAEVAGDIPIIGDGGIKYSGDIAKALSAGASSIMIGSLFAGTEESPGRNMFIQGRKFKKYRGMGSIGAMSKGSKDRYFQKDVTETKKFVPEGIEGIVPYRGLLSEVTYQLLGGVRSAMGYCGAHDLIELRTKTKHIKITSAALKESHPHDVTITEESPNYSTPDHDLGFDSKMGR